MPTPFLSSEEYDERAHELYNQGEYDEALEVLREGLSLYPNAVELHIGVGYARLAREEYAWARRSFEEAVDRALTRARLEGVVGGAVTPFLLAAVEQETGGRSLGANLALLASNAKLAAEIAVALATPTA